MTPRLVLLADMPVNAALIDKLIVAFDPEKGALVVLPTRDGERGNPVFVAALLSGSDGRRG